MLVSPAMQLKWHLILVAAGILACAACSTPALRAETLRPSLPAAFEQGASSGDAWPRPDWYRTFGSEELAVLEDEAARSNLDRAAASARVRQALARARAAGAARLPSVDFGADVTRVTGRTDGESARETDWSALLSASYELDFWGRNAALGRSAQLSSLASRAEADTLALTTSAAVADTYFQVLSARERLDIARSNLRIAQDVLSVVRARFDAGVVGAMELAAQRAAVANASLVIPALEQVEGEARATLALLLGRAPQGFQVNGAPLESLAVPEVAAGLPSELLRRRPDVAAAEYALMSAHADLQVARAEMFPGITLTLTGGVQNPAVQAAVTTLAGTGSTFSAAAGLLQSVFDGGRRRAVRDEARAREQELLAAYRSAVLASLKDTQDALSAVSHLREQRDLQQENLDQCERAFAAAQARFRAGSGDFLSVLDSQRNLQAARDQLSQYRLERLRSVINLYKALGGGWQQSAAAP